MTVDTYKLLWEQTERTSPALLTSNGTTNIHRVNELVTITRIQKNIDGVAEWGQLLNGNWIRTVWNGIIRAELITADPVPPDEPPPPVTLEDFLTVTQTTSYEIRDSQGRLLYTGTSIVSTELRKPTVG